MGDEQTKGTTGAPGARRGQRLKEEPTREYGPWEVEPELFRSEVRELRTAHPEMTALETMHEGSVTYLRFWNFWVRMGTPAEAATDRHFQDYESTDSHVYVGVYLTGRWYHLDPTAVYAGPLPDLGSRRSVGLFASVDYQHPFSARPVPLSPLDRVPHLPD